MKKTFLSFTILVFVLIISSCNSTNNKESLEGTWKKANIENDNYIIKFKGNTWQYSKNNEVISKGIFTIKDDQLTFSEENSGHDHGHEHEGHRHSHDTHCKDMIYKFLLNDTEFKLIKDKSTSIYNKIK
jgi:hypothetical protein